MSNHKYPDFGSHPDADLAEADALLMKADALLRRHRFGGTEPSPATIDDDLPILTEIIEDLPPVPAQSAVTAHADLAEQLVELDTELNREIEAWFANELPELLAVELEILSRQLREKALAHLRATLLPMLSARIARRLDDAASAHLETPEAPDDK
ncbi:MAG TPA: hypothetical protein PLN31_01705 [Azoarcus taiwanensis]|nr:hypothetical protein [Azoarcus taiwanensis]